MGHKPGVVLCTHSGAYASTVFNILQASDHLDVVAIVNSTRILRRQESTIRSGLTLVQQCGPAYVLAMSLATAGFNLLSRDSLFSLAKKHHIPVLNTTDINDQQGREFLQQHQPDYIISAFFNQLLSPDVIGLAPGRCINIHPSLLPDYKGVDPAFFMLLNDEQEFGVTIHQVDEGIDTGDIIAQGRVAVEQGEDLYGLYRKLFAHGAQLVTQVINSEGRLNSLPEKQQGEGRYDSWPTTGQVKQFRSKGRQLISYRSLRDSLFTS